MGFSFRPYSFTFTISGATHRMFRLAILIYLMMFGLVSEPVRGGESTNSDDDYCVALFTGSGEQNPFWILFVDFMSAAANDLGIQLEVFYADGSRNRMQLQIREVCERADKPDCIVFQSFKKNGARILRLCQRYDMPVFMVNSGLTDEQEERVGEPRAKLPSWIGEMLPDDEGAGYRLANALIDEARKDPQRWGPDGRVHVIGLNGVVSHEASIQRLKGLKKAIDGRRDEAVLEQVVAADWDKELARKRCHVLHRRYPHASVIWSASDHMAVGAIEAMGDRELTPGKDVIIGGVDATREAMNLIEEGTMCATVGGHFMEGGWVAVLLYDYFNDVDFAQIQTRYKSPMTLVTEKNLATYRVALTKSTWERTDFRQLSREHSPELKSYRFDAQVLTTETGARDMPVTPSNERDASKDDGGRNE